MSKIKFDSNTHLRDAQDFLHALQEDQEGFLAIAKLLRDLCGISLDGNSKNNSLVASRLSSILRQKKISTYLEYLNYLKQGGIAAQNEFVSALTTNTTQFFRESAHFEHLCAYLPTIMKNKMSRGESELRIWCAAASTGQEPYSILINILETLPQMNEWNLKFLATDIDLKVLQKAASGNYTVEEVESLPPMFRMKYFELVNNCEKKYFQTKIEYSRIIQFAEFNLLECTYPFQYKFDIVFCRNVLIYFERYQAEKVVSKILNCINDNGVLYLGHSEGGLMQSKLGASIGPATYLKSSSKHAKVSGGR
jgi:chemotaxis protein methyltransferase CheR